MRGEGSPSAKSVRVTVPGKIMLAGEYAILRGGRCLAASVASRLTLDVDPSLDQALSLKSNLWPEERYLNIRDSSYQSSNEPLIDSLNWAAHRLEVESAAITVSSNLDVSFGLGSSSAVRLAAHLGLLAFQKQSIDLSPSQRWDAARDAWLLQKTNQGFASGYDLVTQLEGGFIEWTADYENWPGTIRHLGSGWLKEWVHPYAGGAGAPTKQIGGSVRQWLDQGRLWNDLTQRTDALIEAFLSQNQDEIVGNIQRHRGLFKDAPFYPHAIDKALASLSDFDRSWSFKTTGAGGEDAILLIGQKSNLTEADKQLRRRGWAPLVDPWSTEGSLIAWKEDAL